MERLSVKPVGCEFQAERCAASQPIRRCSTSASWAAGSRTLPATRASTWKRRVCPPARSLPKGSTSSCTFASAAALALGRGGSSRCVRIDPQRAPPRSGRRLATFGIGAPRAGGRRAGDGRAGAAVGGQAGACDLAAGAGPPERAALCRHHPRHGLRRRCRYRLIEQLETQHVASALSVGGGSLTEGAGRATGCHAGAAAASPASSSGRSNSRIWSTSSADMRGAAGTAARAASTSGAPGMSDAPYSQPPQPHSARRLMWLTRPGRCRFQQHRKAQHDGPHGRRGHALERVIAEGLGSRRGSWRCRPDRRSGCAPGRNSASRPSSVPISWMPSEVSVASTSSASTHEHVLIGPERAFAQPQHVRFVIAERN